VFELPLHTVELPLMAPGCAGVGFTVMANVCAADGPQPLFAVTEMFPFVPAVVLIDVDVEVPIHPPGKVQV
jgi:hypothetical protein